MTREWATKKWLLSGECFLFLFLFPLPPAHRPGPRELVSWGKPMVSYPRAAPNSPGPRELVGVSGGVVAGGR